MSKKIESPLEAMLALDSLATDLAEPIVAALRNTRSLTEAELIFLKSTVDHTIINVLSGETMASVRDYINRPNTNKE